MNTRTVARNQAPWRRGCERPVSGHRGFLAAVGHSAATALAPAMILASTIPARAEDDLFDLSLRDLLSMEVESVSKKSEKAWGVPAAIYVLSAEDIQRSGATRFQELLSLVPGTWFSDHSYDAANSAIREESFFYAGTVLIILDGTPVISPMSGAFIYSLFDIDLASIDRIEVIKGSGGAIYGANAATGIVSIFTRKAEEQVSSATIEGGTNSYFTPAYRYAGGQPGSARYATWVKYKTHQGYDRNEYFDGEKVRVYSPAQHQKIEIDNRYNYDVGDQEIATLGLQWMRPLKKQTQLRSHLYVSQGHGDRINYWPAVWPENPGAIHPDTSFVRREKNDQFVWQVRADIERSPTHTYFTQAFYRREHRSTAAGGGLALTCDAADLEFQDNLRLLERHQLSVGGNIRLVRIDTGDIESAATIRYIEPESENWLYGAFIQDKFMAHRTVEFTLGAKAETWTLIDPRPEISPSVRASFRPSEELTFWSALSRSVTTPGYSTTNIELRTQQLPPEWFLLGIGVPADQIPKGAGKWATVTTVPNVKPTDYRTMELGFRMRSTQRFSLDWSGFYTRVHDRIVAADIDPNRLVDSRTRSGEEIVPIYYSNLSRGETWGGETVAHHIPNRWVRIEASHSWFRSAYRGQAIPGTERRAAVGTLDHPMTPEHVLRTRCYFDLPREWRATWMGMWSTKTGEVTPYNYVDQRSATMAEGGVVLDDRPSRFDFDVVLEKRLLQGRLAVRAWGRDLLAAPHVEAYDFYAYAGYPQTVNRSVGLGVSWRP